MKTRLLLSSLFLLEVLIISFALAHRSPMSGDDYSYIYQAKLFASGKLYAQDPIYDPRNSFYESVQTSCIKDLNGHRFSQYPPGWPAVFAIGVALGAPWIVNPLLAAALMFLVLWYVEQQMGKEWVTTAWLLLALCLFVAFYAASFRAHIAAALFVFGAFLAYEAAERDMRYGRIWLFAAGALLGYTSTIRYIDWIPLCLWIGFSKLRRKHFADLTFFIVGFALLASINLFYNALLFGNPLQSPTRIGGLDGNPDGLTISWRGFPMTGIRLINLVWVFPPVVLLGLLCRSYRPSPKAKMYLALFGMNVGVYFFFAAAAAGPGPRFFLAYFPFLILALVDLDRWICRERTNLCPVWKLGIACLIVGNLIFVGLEGHKMFVRRDLQATVSHAEPGKKLFLVKTGTYPGYPHDLTRNPPNLSAAENLYFLWCAQPARDALLDRFPGRKVYVYEYPAVLRPYIR